MMIIMGTIFGIGTLSMLGLIISNVWLWNEFKHLRSVVWSQPTVDEIIEKIVHTKIPIISGPNGKPIIKGMDNPLTG